MTTTSSTRLSSARSALASACSDVVDGSDADAVDGVPVALLARPASTEEVAGVLRAAAGHGLTVVPRGRGTKSSWGRPPESADVVVDLSRMSAVLDHAAGGRVDPAAAQARAVGDPRADRRARRRDRLAGRADAPRGAAPRSRRWRARAAPCPSAASTPTAPRGCPARSSARRARARAAPAWSGPGAARRPRARGARRWAGRARWRGGRRTAARSCPARRRRSPARRRTAPRASARPCRPLFRW